MIRKKHLFFALAALMMMINLNGVAKAESHITFGKTTFENNFPDGLTFRASVSSTEEEIVSAKLHYSTRQYIGTESSTRFEVEIEPGMQVDLEYLSDTSESGAVPSTPINFYWEVTDAAGNKAQSEEMFVEYDDNRFDWEKLENNNIRIWWHDKPSSFGKDVMGIAERAIRDQRQLFGAELETPVMIIVYNNLDEFNSWHSVPRDWVGGEAYAGFGITTQIVTSRTASRAWLNDVVPHEISHLYFAQVTYNGSAPTPSWLNEGVAQYNEFNDHGWGINRSESAARNGELLPLSVLEDGFGSFNEDRIYLSYAEALSAIVYMVETYGEEGMADLLAAYKSGQATDKAFLAAFGVSMGQFESDWSVWLGAPEGALVTSTPWPMPTFPASPTFMSSVRGNDGSDATAEIESTSVAEVEPSDIPEEEPEPPVNEDESSDDGFLPGCFSAMSLLVLGFGMAIQRRRKRFRLI